MEDERTLLLRNGAVKVRVRRSSRARRIRLVMLPRVGPELVVPDRASGRAIDGALVTFTPWLERTLARQASDLLGLARPGVAWHGGEAVALRLVEAKRLSAGWSDGALELRAPDREGAATVLERWYRDAAREALAASIELQAPELGVTHTSLVVRDQKTRWGSCSSRGTLSFSWRLLLAPAWVLDDIVCHELCHLRVRNHSQTFWSLLDRHRRAADSRPWLRAHGPEVATYLPIDSIGVA